MDYKLLIHCRGSRHPRGHRHHSPYHCGHRLRGKRPHWRFLKAQQSGPRGFSKAWPFQETCNRQQSRKVVFFSSSVVGLEMELQRTNTLSKDTCYIRNVRWKKSTRESLVSGAPSGQAVRPISVRTTVGFTALLRIWWGPNSTARWRVTWSIAALLTL